MQYFFPDSQDLVDPSFDFETERRSIDRVRQRDDVYAHELFSRAPYDGLLVSKAIVDGIGAGAGRYTLGQRQRLLREGAHRFFRTRIPIMGDCGAFTYVREKTPPYSVDSVLEFYETCGFNAGVSVDHVILEYEPEWDSPRKTPKDVRERQEITLTLGAEFLKRHKRAKLAFKPLGVAQGWSPDSYARAVSALQKMGYDYIAVGGMVPLKTREVLESLAGIDRVRHAKTRLHLLGITRLDQMGAFADFGVASFDSTSPLRQAFKDKDDNYYAPDRTYIAVRVPQVEGNPKLQKAIRAGQVSQPTARRLELACLDALRKLDHRKRTIDAAVQLVHEYEQLFDAGRDNREAYREVLTDKPWRRCACDVCKALGHHVVIFRGAERNRRRGLHNVWVFYRQLHRELRATEPRAPVKRRSGRTSSESRVAART